MSAGHLVCVTSGLGIQKLNCAKQALIWIPTFVIVTLAGIVLFLIGMLP
jgi:hypothetical protein